MAARTPVPESVKGRELPPALAEKYGIDPDEEVRFLILGPRDEANTRITALMDRISGEAKDKGLTEETLKRILDGE